MANEWERKDSDSFWYYVRRITHSAAALPSNQSAAAKASVTSTRTPTCKDPKDLVDSILHLLDSCQSYYLPGKLRLILNVHWGLGVMKPRFCQGLATQNRFSAGYEGLCNSISSGGGSTNVVYLHFYSRICQ